MKDSKFNVIVYDGVIRQEPYEERYRSRVLEGIFGYLIHQQFSKLAVALKHKYWCIIVIGFESPHGAVSMVKPPRAVVHQTERGGRYKDSAKSYLFLILKAQGFPILPPGLNMVWSFVSDHH